MPGRTHASTLLAGLLLAATASGGALAQADYPARVVRIIVPFGPGGLTDNLTRLFAKELSERLGQPFILDFKPGASTNIGAAAVAAAPPDGHTLFVATLASNALNKWTYKNLSYDPDRLATVGMMGVNTFYLVVRPDSPYASVQDLVRAARESSNGLVYGSHGNGGANHLITELFRTRAGIRQLLHVAYKGPESHLDLMAGRTDFMIDGAAINLVQAGKLKALAVAYPKRWPTQPNLPTMAEAGFPDVTIATFFGLSAPPGTAAPILDKLNATLRAIAATPEVEKRLLAMNMLPMPATRQETAEFIRQQSEKWGPVLKSLNISFE
ncbi:MAG: tripartite tricarboxylate transporter substrate binding protein [Burkholderiales bacterium]|nr:tripartite tricarboxylate transporter substrate binding protein [Burkholderiales bacterium]